MQYSYSIFCSEEKRNYMLILFAGMQRSASTWLYNVLRILIQESKSYDDSFQFGWVDDFVEISSGESRLIKVHNFSQALADKADYIFYSYRDLRDVLASLKRKFNNNPTAESAQNLVDSFNHWQEVAVYSMCYEHMLSNKLIEIVNIAKCLDITDVEPTLVLNQLKDLSFESKGTRNDVYHKENLFHKGHITNGKIGNWHNELADDFVEKLTNKHRDWFRANGYVV
jgi:hypothetical protein